MSKKKLVANLREHSKYLSHEFLTWLFLCLDHEENSKNFEDIVLGNKLVLIDLQNSEQKISISSPLLEERSEIFAGLKSGFVIDCLGLNFKFGEISVSCVVHAGDLALGNVKINNNFDDTFKDEQEELSEFERNREALYLRAGILDDLEIALKNLLDFFITIRLNHQKYSQEINKMQCQIEERLSKFQDESHSSREYVKNTSEINAPPVL